MGSVMSLGGVDFTATAIRPLIDKRTTTIDFERSSSGTKAVATGGRRWEVMGLTRTQADFDALEVLFVDEPEAFLDDQQRGEKYTGTYILGNFEAEDRTFSTTNYRFTFTLWDKGDIGPTGGIGEFTVGEHSVGE